MNIKLKDNLKNNSALITFFILFILTWILKGDIFFNWRNILNILLNNSIVGIIALGMSFIIFTGGIDLSVGSQLAGIGLIVISVLNKTGNIFIAIAVGILAGILTGALTGIFISKFNIPPFIVTLGTMSVYRSLSQHFFNGGGVRINPNSDNFLSISNIRFFDSFSIIILYWILISLTCLIISKKTGLGKHIYATGSNEKATRLSGINTDRIKIITYTLSGILVSLAAIIEASRLGSMNSASSGISYEMDAIAAVVIGGTSMSGGKGRILGTVFGTLTLGIINNMMNLLGVPTFLVSAIKGAIIIGAVLVQNQVNKKSN